MTREVTVNGSAPALVDDADYEFLSQFSWHRTRHGYAATTIGGKNVKMHRLILGVTDKSHWVDHANMNKLDNRRCNLRIATPSQSNYNQVKRGRAGGTPSSKYKGVYKPSHTRLWRSTATINGKSTHVGYFETEIEAAKAYDRVMWKHIGPFARLNFPDDCVA